MPVYKEMFTAIDVENDVWSCSTCNHIAKTCKTCKVLLGGKYIKFYYCVNKKCKHYFWNEETGQCKACDKKN